MRRIRCVLKQAEEYETREKKLSEIDTQVLLVEPILCIAGYDIYNPRIVKRASRNPQSKEFDIEVYKRNKLFLAIEVKALSSNEFNINSQNNIGALKKKNCKWTNNEGDGVGQIRAYCLNLGYRKINTAPIPILTNGLEWAIFHNHFLDEGRATVAIDKEKDAKVYNITDMHSFLNLLKKIKNE